MDRGPARILPWLRRALPLHAPTGAEYNAPVPSDIWGRRLAAQAGVAVCAGCHAPQNFLGPERKIGCWIHTPYYPNRKTVTWRIFIWDDQGVEPGRLAYYKKVEEAPMPDDPDLREGHFRFRACRCGNAIIALPPDRGRPANRRADYHDPALPPRHALVAFGLKHEER